MTNRKVTALVASVAKDETSINRVDVIARLSAANAKERVLILSALPMGEVAAIGGRVAGIGSSVYEVLNIKMCELHGADWAHIAKALPSALGDADKTRRKAIIASLESIRETVKANAAGDAQKGSDAIKAIKEWGLGKRKSKSAPKTNEKQAIGKWAMSWDAFPSTYRRIMKDDMEDMTTAKADAMLAVADAIAAYFKACQINPQSVLDCTGKGSWNN